MCDICALKVRNKLLHSLGAGHVLSPLITSKHWQVNLKDFKG